MKSGDYSVVILYSLLKRNMKNQKKYCLNCESPLEVHQEYCSNCGQAKKDGKLSVFALLKDSLTSFFNLDGRLVHTIRDLYRPSKLTRYYVAGKRKYYVNAGRLFLLTMIILLALSRKLVVDDSFSEINSKTIENYELAKQKEMWDSLVAIGPPSDQLVIKPYTDSMYQDINIDSLYIISEDRFITIGEQDLGRYNILTKDAMELSPSQVIENYEVKGFFQALVIKQYIKFIKHPSETIWSIVSQLVWIILFLNLALAGFLKLIYIRGKYYYIEHLTLSLYGHSFFFIITSIAIVITLLFGQRGEGSMLVTMGSFAAISTAIVFFTSLLRYYQNGWMKTFFKWIMILIFYTFALIIFVTFGAVISLLLV